MLWPEEDPILQRARLRYELSTLRSALGPTIFHPDQGNKFVQLAPAVTSDTADFDAALQASVRSRTAEQRIPLLQKLVSLYTAPLLPGLFLPDKCPPEYDWLSLERDRFHESCFEAHARLITDLETLGLYDDAQQYRREAGTRFADRELPPSLPTPAFTSAVTPVHTTGSSSPEQLLGRDKELQFVRDWAVDAASGGPADTATSRLLTLTGTGGVGKTRLAQEATGGPMPIASVFVSLADVDRGDRLFTALHSALRLPLRGAGARTQVEEALRVRGPLVLVLDNLEHIVPEVSELVRELLESCPLLKILATSRRSLGVPQESVLPVSPLTLDPALNLFLNRARQLRHDFAQTPPALQAVREAAALLEGIPLALELAASRAAFLGPIQIRRQLSQRLSFLVSVRPGRTARHESMTATLAWSVDLLSETEKYVLAALAVFRSGATMEAVGAVCGEGSGETIAVSSQILDALENLQIHSLLIATYDDEDQPRFGLLVVIREFAEQRIVSADALRQMRQRHFAYYAFVSQAVQQAFREGRWSAARDTVTRELENIRSAIVFCATAGPEEAERAFHLMEGVAASLFELGFWEDVESLMQIAAPAAAGHQRRELKHLGLVGALARRRGDEAAAHNAWVRRLEVARQLGEADPLVDVLLDLGGQALDRKEWSRARLFILEGVALAEREGLAMRLVAGRVLKARLQLDEGAFPESKQSADAAMTLLRTLPDNASQSLYAIIYLVPVYQALKQEKDVGILLAEGFRLALGGSQPFLLARVADAMAPAFECAGRMRPALHSYFLARELHSELGSRLRDESANAFDDFLTRLTGEPAGKEHAPRLLRELAGLNWRSVADLLRGEVAAGFGGTSLANDLPTAAL